MNKDEAAQYLGYRDSEHLEANDISDRLEWWELIKLLTSDTDNYRELLLMFFDEVSDLPMSVSHYNRESFVETFLSNNSDK